MAIIRQLKNFFTKQTIYPVTLTKAVYDENGERLDKIMRDTFISTDSEDYDGVEPRDADTLGGKYTAEDIDKMKNSMSGQYELINDITITEDTYDIIINTDLNGNDFAISDFIIWFKCIGASTNTSNRYCQVIASSTKNETGRSLIGNMAELIPIANKVDLYYIRVKSGGIGGYVCFSYRYGAPRNYPQYDPWENCIATTNKFEICGDENFLIKPTVQIKISNGNSEAPKIGANSRVAIWGIRV